MTPEEFNAAASQTRLKPHSVTVAKAVLVDGVGLTEAGNLINPAMKRQQVSDAVKRVEREHLKAIGAPEGWDCITLVLPKHSEEWNTAMSLKSKF